MRPFPLRGAALAVALLLAAAPAASDETSRRPQVPSITVSAIATAEVVPDLATLVLAVVTERKTATAATTETAKVSAAVVEDLRKEGIEARDIATAAIVSPVYDEERDNSGRFARRNLRGYEARNRITIRLRDTKKAGALARTLIDRGASTLEGISFQVAENEERLDGLRVKAVAESARRAKLYAEAAGVKLGRILTIAPGSPEGPTPYEARMLRMPAPAPMDAAGGAAAIPVEPGTQTLHAQVSVTWELAAP